MLDTLTIFGFKCFDTIDIPLRNMNIFAGINSSGKSSAIQALLLLCHNAGMNASSPLNGMWLGLGTFDECRNHRSNARAFGVGVSGGGNTFSTKFIEDQNVVHVTFPKTSQQLQSHLRLEQKHVFYIPASRVGPEDSYKKNQDRVNFFGNKAEYIVDFLEENGKNEVVEALRESEESVTLEHQVNHWLGKLFGVKNQIQKNDAQTHLFIAFSMGTGKQVRPYHMGSGVSFAMGVIVSCLSAKPGDIVIIENPEIHLHPRAQADLTEFLCFAANAGVQIILETHSDHVFNGVCKAVVKKKISEQDVAIQFFQLDDEFISRNTSIEINGRGRVMQHPKGLFDQFDDDLDQILGL